jgi:hypothetical protein
VIFRVKSLDNPFVHFRAKRDQTMAMFRAHVPDGRVNWIAGYHEISAHSAGVTPDGAPPALRSVKTSEIYAFEWVLR